MGHNSWHQSTPGERQVARICRLVISTEFLCRECPVVDDQSIVEVALKEHMWRRGAEAFTHAEDQLCPGRSTVGPHGECHHLAK